MEYLTRFRNCQQGVTTIEYGLIAFVMGILVVTILSGEQSFISALQAKFELLTATIIRAINYI
ncbi:Flp family type IVb pilin [Pasteurella sp. P03HT]